MSRISVATHIAVALAMMTSSVLLLAHGLGLVPDSRAAHVQTREAITDLLARCVVDAAAQQKFERVDALASEFRAKAVDEVVQTEREVTRGRTAAQASVASHLFVLSTGLGSGGSLTVPTS